MHSANHCGGSFEMNVDDEHSRNLDLDPAALSRQLHELDETQQSWLLGPQDGGRKRVKYIDLGSIVVKRKVLWWVFWAVLGAFMTLPKKVKGPEPLDEYSKALNKALMFFNAQRSGKLPKNNGVKWRGDSGLKDGSTIAEIKGGLVGGYYDAGDNIKFHFPMAFSMTLLSWSVIEYSHKYAASSEYEHVRSIIKWGTDYLLKTFNSTGTNIDKVYSQVGVAKNASTTPDDHYCWTRPEDMDYPRPVTTSYSAPDLGGEMAAALASASIVFRDDIAYSKKLLKGASTIYSFARSYRRRTPYSRGSLDIALFYNSSGYWDEYMWSAGWMYYATGNKTYIQFATDVRLAKNAKAYLRVLDYGVLSWDNKLPAAMLLWTRLRIFLNPGYPYEESLSRYHNVTGLNMCSYLKEYSVYNFTKGGLIQLNHGQLQTLQYVVNAAFLANLYADYMEAGDAPGWYCGDNFFASQTLRNFAFSQLDYILGGNPQKMSYIVGYGKNYPKHVHHRGASIPHNGVKYSCRGGAKWRDTKKANPNIIVGAMVGGPDKNDGFSDVRTKYSYTEPTLAGNAGLVAALTSMTNAGDRGIDKNTIFSAILPMYPGTPPPPPPPPRKP